MTGTAPSTSVSPSPRRMWQHARGPLLAAVVLVLAGLVLAAVRSGDRYGLLDPRSAKPQGSRAVAQLLAERGVETTVITTTAEAAAAAGPDTTVLVVHPELLTGAQHRALRTALTAGGGRTVLLSAGPGTVGSLAPGVRVHTPVEVEPRPPECDLPAARRAGDAGLGGFRYATSAPHSSSCYLSGGHATLLRLPTGDGDTVLLGSPDFLRNEQLARHGNASLALQLLGSRPHLVWYLPSLGDAAADDGRRSFYDLIPDGWRFAALQLGIAAVLAALWRSRRLGPLVPERLPVAVPAAEATEGRARLYRRANARDRAADALRSATRARLAPLVGVPPARAQLPEVLGPAVASHADSDTDAVVSLLFGPVPADDAALIRLADDLDRLQHRITPPPRDKDRTS